MGGNPTFKHTAITRAGYEYQDLVGIEVLIRHYRDPDLFSWVQLEADDTSIRSLDDVVALRKDGSVEYTQVKFTVDSDKYELDWDWLLESKEAGSSMLSKWAISFFQAKANGPIHSARLKTNRIASQAFAKCLDGGFVDIGRVEEGIRAKVESACGGADRATEFLAAFAFMGGELDFDHYETSLRDQLVPSDTDSTGWLLLKEHVRRWAILKGEPHPGGKILREHVVQLISKRRPQPIRQDFHVPDGYMPPTSAFDANIRKRVADESRPITVLWGTPGRGKSTYLSYLAQELHRGGDLIIRHHYFLSQEDTTPNRMSFVDIANSLMHQLFSRYPEVTAGVVLDTDNNLRGNLSRAAANAAALGKRLYLIVDGLDHVWRDTARIDQLDHLFNEILPVARNLGLIVGTQRVADSQLPFRLLRATNDDDWMEIPRMDQVAVQGWVRSQDQARPFLLSRTHPTRSSEIDAIGAALFAISQGHPLHLIYALESLVRSGRAFGVDDVEAIPPCPDGDIRTYYKGLWTRLSSSARTILHMLSGSDFFWPGLGIRQCVGDYSEIDFLLEPRNIGMLPFHGSIFAYVRERDDHEEIYRSLLPRIVAWLQNDAPEYWRWGWLWLTKARGADWDELLTGTSRAWAIESLANGWPTRQMVNILAAAEARTFEIGDLAATVRLRALKTRISNAREFQAADFGFFQGVALAIAGNIQQTLNLLDDVQGLADDEVASLAKYSPAATRSEVVAACLGELARRINAWIALRHRPEHEFTKLTEQLIEIAARAGQAQVKRVLRYLRGFRDPHPYCARYIRLMGAAMDLDGLVAVRRELKGKKWLHERRLAADYIVRAASFRGADPLPLIRSKTEKFSPFVGTWVRIAGPGKPQVSTALTEIAPNLLREYYQLGDNDDLTQFFYDAFWAAADVAADVSFVYPPLKRDEMEWMQIALACLEDVAWAIGRRELAPSFGAIYDVARRVDPVPFKGRNEGSEAQYRGFRAALLRIALDLHLIAVAKAPDQSIPASELELARSSEHWLDAVWISRNATDQIRWLDRDGAGSLLDDAAAELSGKVTEFNERSGLWAEYASLAALYGVNDAPGLIRRSADCLLGYGWRKDLGALDLLDAVAQVHRYDPSRTAPWIKAVTPAIDQITEFTDGDETDYVRSELIDLVGKASADLLPRFYEHHIAVDEWRYADETLEAILQQADLSSPSGTALAATLLDEKSLYVLEKRSSAADERASALLDRQNAFLGRLPPPHHELKATEDKLTEEEIAAISRDPTSFGASEFSAVAEAVGARHFHYKYRSEFLSRWIHHWSDNGEAAEALAAVRSFFDAESQTYGVEEILDPAFEVSLASQGRDAAYSWLVAAQIHRHGWQTHFTSEDEVIARLELAAKIYPERWLEFIRASSVPAPFWRRRRSSFTLGYQYLVRFLVLAGQMTTAAAVTDEFVRTFLDEVSDQPIPEATWLG